MRLVEISAPAKTPGGWTCADIPEMRPGAPSLSAARTVPKHRSAQPGGPVYASIWSSERAALAALLPVPPLSSASSLIVACW
jgi:hypothetical protein